ncbi:emopamil-binding family protein [Streptomyces sp. NPDC049555]|uniref:EXPERA domain-containing protein n=1 Tax=unclassified Streptomyces TaxID=2593676 RepID=UPI003429C85F
MTARAWTTAPASRPGLPRKDRLTLSFLGFSLVLAFSLELYFILHFRTIRTRKDPFAALFALYGAGDRTYYGEGDVYLPFALETLNVCVTQVLNLALIRAVLRGSRWRYPLQLTVASYLSYSVVLYFWHAHAAGYPAMPEHDAYGYFIFYAPNLPWLLGNLWMGAEAFGELGHMAGRGGSQGPPLGKSAQDDGHQRTAEDDRHVPGVRAVREGCDG